MGGALAILGGEVMMHPLEAKQAFAAPPLPQAVLVGDVGQERYRTRLWRWSRVQTATAKASAVLFVMLNPSTADGEQDDPTIRRCRSFQERDGFDLLLVANLFEWRATDPRDLERTPIERRNTSGSDLNLVQLATVADRVIVGWGDQGRRHPERVEKVLGLLLAVRGCVYCLGKSLHGAPRHPLMVRRDTEVQVFRGAP